MNKRRLTALSFLIFILLLTSLSYAQTHLVKRVIDGDTIQLSNGEQVRLIGVDTPEIKHPKKPVECFGKEASAFTEKTVEGKEVRWSGEKLGDHLHSFKNLKYLFLVIPAVRILPRIIFLHYYRDCRKSPNLAFMLTLCIVKSNSYNIQNERFRVFRQSLTKC